MNNIDILEELVVDAKKEISIEERQAIVTLIAENKELKEDRKKYTEEYIHNNPWLYKQLAENYILKSKVEKLLKEKIEWCIKASNSGLNAIQYACSKEDEIERIERQKNISTMISILKEMSQELLDERNNTNV